MRDCLRILQSPACGRSNCCATCKLKSVTCNNCGKTGHIAKVCCSNPTGAKSSAARQKGKAARGHSPEKEDSPPREGSKVHSLYNFSSSSNKLFRVTLHTVKNRVLPQHT